MDTSAALHAPATLTRGRYSKEELRELHRRMGLAALRRRRIRTGVLITLNVAVPNNMDAAAREALENYASATAKHDPRADLNALLEKRSV